MQNDLKKLFTQAVRDGSLDFSDLAMVVFRELARTGSDDIPDEERIARIVSDVSNGVLSSEENEAVARGVLDLFRPIIAAQRVRIAELETFMGSNDPWPTLDAVKRLVDAADHLLDDHSCDAHGYEGLMFARDAMRQRLERFRK